MNSQTSDTSSITDPMAQAEKLKLEGNALQLDGQYDAANATYSQAIELHPQNAVLYANRAQSYLKLKRCVSVASYIDTALIRPFERYPDAAQDASKVSP